MKYIEDILEKGLQIVDVNERVKFYEDNLKSFKLHTIAVWAHKYGVPYSTATAKVIRFNLGVFVGGGVRLLDANDALKLCEKLPLGRPRKG